MGNRDICTAALPQSVARDLFQDERALQLLGNALSDLVFVGSRLHHRIHSVADVRGITRLNGPI